MVSWNYCFSSKTKFPYMQPPSLLRDYPLNSESHDIFKVLFCVQLCNTHLERERELQCDNSLNKQCISNSLVLRIVLLSTKLKWIKSTKQ